MFVNKLFTHLTCAYLKSKRCFNVKYSTSYFHIETKILADFHFCISVPLIYSKVKTSQILHDGTTPVVPSKNWIKAISIHLIRKTFPGFHSYLVEKNHKKNHAYLTDSE